MQYAVQEFSEFVDLLRNIAWARFRDASGSPQQCFEKLLDIIHTSAGAKQGGPLLRSVTVRTDPLPLHCWPPHLTHLQSTSTHRGVFSRLTDSTTFTGTHKSISTRLQRERERTAAHAKASQASTMMDQQDIDAVIGDASRSMPYSHAAYGGGHYSSTPYSRASGDSGGRGSNLPRGGDGPVAAYSAGEHRQTQADSTSHRSPNSLASAGTASLLSPRTPRGSTRPSRHRRVSMTQSEKDTERRQRLTALVLADYGNDGDNEDEEQQRYLSALDGSGGVASPLQGGHGEGGYKQEGVRGLESGNLGGARDGSTQHGTRVRAGRMALQVSPVTRGDSGGVDSGPQAVGFGHPPTAGRRRPAALKGAATLSLGGTRD